MLITTNSDYTFLASDVFVLTGKYSGISGNQLGPHGGPDDESTEVNLQRVQLDIELLLTLKFFLQCSHELLKVLCIEQSQSFLV